MVGDVIQGGVRLIACPLFGTPKLHYINRLGINCWNWNVIIYIHNCFRVKYVIIFCQMVLKVKTFRVLSGCFQGIFRKGPLSKALLSGSKTRCGLQFLPLVRLLNDMCCTLRIKGPGGLLARGLCIWLLGYIQDARLAVVMLSLWKFSIALDFFRNGQEVGPLFPQSGFFYLCNPQPFVN